jgi:hypothetical protein
MLVGRVRVVMALLLCVLSGPLAGCSGDASIAPSQVRETDDAGLKLLAGRWSNVNSRTGDQLIVIIAESGDAKWKAFDKNGEEYTNAGKSVGDQISSRVRATEKPYLFRGTLQWIGATSSPGSAPEQTFEITLNPSQDTFTLTVDIKGENGKITPTSLAFHRSS